MSSWVMATVGVVVAIAAGVALAICRKYYTGWQWNMRSIWSICEDWRQRISWLWAPREEKVGLVKAQHPTAQTIPGLYRHPGNMSQYLLHSDSDLRLDAQGAFTRFEAVDKDLHPPSGTGNIIPPQPLRPAPQPRPTARPRPSPLPAPGTGEYLRMQDSGPLTPPLMMQNSTMQRGNQARAFVFHHEPLTSHNHYSKSSNEQLHFNSYSSRLMSEGFQTAVNQSESLNYEHDNREEQMKNTYLCNSNQEIPYKQYDFDEDAAKLEYGISPSHLNKHSVQITPGYDTMSSNKHLVRHHMENSSRDTFNAFNFTNSNQTNIYGSQAAIKLQNTPNYCDDFKRFDNVQNIEMTPFRNTDVFQDELNYHIRENIKMHGLQRVSNYIQSLPDVPIYDTASETTCSDQMEDEKRLGSDENELIASPVPPPAPPDPSNQLDIHIKNGPTTGERIFNALRSVASQSYIDASEFYNSVCSSAQQSPMLAFAETQASSIQSEKCSPADSLRQGIFYEDSEPDAIDIDGLRRASDLYSPELNFEAQRTAQEVYNSLQDPPSSPLLLKDLSQDPYPYMSDPSFTRTSEDIFNSLEQRKKSMEKLNGFHDCEEMKAVDPVRRRSSQDLYNALEEVQMKRRLSQAIDDSYGYLIMDIGEGCLGNHRAFLGPEPEPPLDEENLKRAISCESVCSDTSVVLGNLEEVTVTGHICVGLEYEKWSGRRADYCEGDLAISVLEARDLVTPDGRPAEDTLARVCLLPDRQTYVQTRLYRGSPSPSYQEKFLFPLEKSPIGRTLLVEVFSVVGNMGGESFLLGETSLKLGPAMRPPATTWLPLISPALPVPQLGELLFSLSYLPTAERLTLVVVKARNLCGLGSISGDFFVKVYLLQHGKKIHKKKTSAKRGEKSPTFNEAMIFNVPAHTLQTIQLRLTVAEVNSDSTYSVGHVIIGSSTTGKSLTHWRQMLTTLRRPIVMWHPLRK